jgi:hypothetical protein
MNAAAEALAQRLACPELYVMGEISSLANLTQDVLPAMQLPCNW